VTGDPAISVDCFFSRAPRPPVSEGTTFEFVIDGLLAALDRAKAP